MTTDRAQSSAAVSTREGGALATFQADPDQMTGLASRLSSVVSCLTSEAHGGFASTALGHPDAITALESFVSGWSHGRSEIATGVTSVQGALRGAATAYTAVDSAAGGAFDDQTQEMGV